MKTSCIANFCSIDFTDLIFQISQFVLVFELVTILSAYLFIHLRKITFKYKDVILLYFAKLLVLYEVMLFID